MLADTSTRSLGRGSLASGVHKPNIFLMQLVDFIAEHLGRWRDHPERQAVQSEPELNAQLGAYLNGEARYSMDVVQFTMEVPDSVQPGRRLDIAAQPSCAQIRVEGRSYTRFDVLLPITRRSTMYIAFTRSIGDSAERGMSGCGTCGS